MKQSAFESPTNDASMNMNAASGIAPFTTAAGKDSILFQRQRLRKTGPFVVQSQSIPDSRTKYAGSWPPPAYESDSEHYTAPQPPPNGQKPVSNYTYSASFGFLNCKFTKFCPFFIRFLNKFQAKKTKYVIVAPTADLR